MGKNKGSVLINIIVTSVILSMFFCISLKINNTKYFQNIEETKIKICNFYKKYANLAFNSDTNYYINFDYQHNILTSFDNNNNKLESIKLPSNIKCITVYSNEIKQQILAKITENGNVSPLFTIYIFDNKKIAKYRIALYGFDILKHIKINIYKNKTDNTAKLENIINFHNKFQAESNKKWVKE